MLTSSVDFALAFSTGLVAAVLLLSACLKLGHSDRTLRAMGSLKMPVVVQRKAIAVALPLFELVLAIAIMILPGLARTIAGVAALLTFIFFTSILIRALRFSEDVDCGCFGMLSVQNKVTGWSVARNFVLIIASAVAVAGGAERPSFVSEIVRGQTAANLLLLVSWLIVVVAALGVGFWRLRTHAVSVKPVRQDNPVSRRVREVAPLSAPSIALGIDPSRPDELDIGSPIPNSELVGSNGITAELSQIGNGRPTLLIFLSADCSSCDVVGESVLRWAEMLEPVQLRLATSSTPSAFTTKFPGVGKYTLYGSRSALVALGVQRSPAAVALGGSQQPVIASPIAYGPGEIQGLVEALCQVSGR